MLELHLLLQCIAAHLQHTLHWVCRETQYLGIFSVNFHSGSVARSWKPWRPCWEDANSTKSSAKSNRLILQLPAVTPLYSAVTVYRSHADQACTTHGPMRKLFLRPARPFSSVENVAKARPRISNCRSRISSILQGNLHIEMK